MRRSVGGLLSVVGVLALAAPARAVNPQVAALQVALSAKRLYAGKVDGVSGSATQSAVRSLQREAELTVDGDVGTATRAALGRLGRYDFGSRLLKRGRVGWDVSVLQFVLAARRDSPGTLDGRFGGETEAAVVRFQTSAGLVPDGIVGPRTIARLCPTPTCDSLPRSLLVTRTQHRVRRGETLTAIAARYGTTVAGLEQANDLGPDAVLQIGQSLRLPALEAEAAWPLDHVSRERIDTLLDRWARRARLDPALARAVGLMESGLQPNVRSSTGEWGVMQVRSETWDFVESALLRHWIRHTTSGNIRVGTAYLAWLLREYGGDQRLALAAYHQGSAALRRWGVLPESERYVQTVFALKNGL
jgi:peptidoglycan hydrolase-like protein with peptidoglycan-binding domain